MVVEAQVTQKHRDGHGQTPRREGTRDRERELASELPRTDDQQQHYKQEDEGPDRPSPLHQDNG